jgi:hypothetical protein
MHFFSLGGCIRPVADLATDTNYLPAGLAYIFYSLSPLQTWEWAAKLLRNFHRLAASVSSTEAGPLLEPKQVLASFP